MLSLFLVVKPWIDLRITAILPYHAVKSAVSPHVLEGARGVGTHLSSQVAHLESLPTTSTSTSSVSLPMLGNKVVC